MREKNISNPPLHDGLILLIYKHIRVHYVGKFIKEKGVADDEEESKDSLGFSETNDSEVMHSIDDNATKI